MMVGVIAIENTIPETKIRKAIIINTPPRATTKDPTSMIKLGTIAIKPNIFQLFLKSDQADFSNETGPSKLGAEAG
jgi:hypothetical protein